MASNGNDDYMECILKIDTSKGWERSLSRVLTRFKDLSYEVNPSIGFIYLKGKANPGRILMKLTRGCKHASIHWVSYGFPSDDPNQVAQDPQSCNDPFHQAIIRDPYNNYDAHYYNQFYYYYPWYNTEQLALAQGGGGGGLNQRQLLALEHEPYYCGGNNSSGSGNNDSSHIHHCPMHSQRHNNHSPLGSSSQSHHSPVQPEVANNHQPTTNKLVPNKDSFAKSILRKLLLLCS